MEKLMIICMFLVHAFNIHAQSNSLEVEAEIRALENKEHKAMLNQDAKTLQQIWATDFMVNAPFNRVTIGSQEVLDLVKKGVIKYSLFTRNIEQIMVKKDMVITMGNEEIVPVGDIPNTGKVIKRR